MLKKIIGSFYLGLCAFAMAEAQSTTINGLTWTYRDTTSWELASGKCARMAQRLPEVVEIQNALNQGLVAALPQLKNNLNTSGGHGSIWSAERAGNDAVLAVTLNGGEHRTHIENQFHTLCVDGEGNGHGHGHEHEHGHGHGYPLQYSFRCEPVKSNYSSLENIAILNVTDASGNIVRTDINTLYRRTECEALTSRLQNNCRPGSLCSVQYCEPDKRDYPSLENTKFNVVIDPHGALRVTAVDHFSRRMDCLKTIN